MFLQLLSSKIKMFEQLSDFEGLKSSLGDPFKLIDQVSTYPYSLDAPCEKVVAGTPYWAAMASGFRQYSECNRDVSVNNVYARYLVNLLVRGSFDKNLALSFFDEEKVCKRVALRFEDVINVMSGVSVKPVKCYISNGPASNLVNVELPSGGNETYNVSMFDGYHRMFWSWLFGRSAIGVELDYSRT
jgi:hypothetical protein